MTSLLRVGIGCLIAFLLFSITGCRTTTIPTFEPIPVPPGLTAPQVEVAILHALVNTPIPKELSEGADIADRAMTALFGPLRYQSARSARNRPEWFPESRAPGEILAGMNYKRHYLQVKIGFDTTAVRVGISNSRNLTQSETRIHKNAIQWIEQLDVRLRRSLGFMSAYRSGAPQEGLVIDSIQR